MGTDKPLLGITMGDPAGVGPEIIVKTLADADTHAICRPLVIGDAGVMADAAKRLGSTISIRGLQDIAAADFDPGKINILDQQSMPPDALKIGQVSPAAGRAAFLAIETAIEMALRGEIDGTVTAPINKEALNMAGYHYAGHTEIYAQLTGTRDYAMLLADGHMRVAHVSTHVSLKEACARVRKQRVLKVIQLSHQACQLFGIQTPRVAVAGLNPHAGENGMFGTEEIDEIIPAIETAAAAGIRVEGPVPPDTLFPKLNGRIYDIAVAMYHDQGHIPMKLMGFNFGRSGRQAASMRGVNVTLGLPIVRSSVDHGTAFDIAGRGTANHESMRQAIEYGARLAKRDRLEKPPGA
jgi:4-hydroxythreonine-4-phosphate dehydrogenase